MIYWPRLALLLALCFASVAATFAGGFLLWEATPFQTISREVVREGSLGRANDAWRARTRFTQELVGELIDGRRTLAEAVARLESYHEQEAPPSQDEYMYGRGILRTVPGDYHRERYGRNLILLVKSHLAGCPELSKTIARLEAELREMVQAEERGGE